MVPPRRRVSPKLPGLTSGLKRLLWLALALIAFGPVSSLDNTQGVAGPATFVRESAIDAPFGTRHFP